MPEESPQYAPFKPILDRILLKLVREDGPKDGFEVPQRFRQQTNKGEVLAVGDVVVLSQNRFQITDFVNIGDYVLFGQYTAEEFESEELKKQFNLTSEDQIYTVRVQDVRGSARKLSPCEHKWTPLTDSHGHHPVPLDWCPLCNLTRPRNA